jgi:hypothetical protein
MEFVTNEYKEYLNYKEDKFEEERKKNINSSYSKNKLLDYLNDELMIASSLYDNSQKRRLKMHEDREKILEEIKTLQENLQKDDEYIKNKKILMK